MTCLCDNSQVSGTSLGQFRLKGVTDKIEIYHCRKAAAGRRRAASTLVDWKWAEQMVRETHRMICWA